MEKEEKVKLISPVYYEGEEKPQLLKMESADEKLYLLLIVLETQDDSDVESRTFQYVKGRQKAYDFIKNMLMYDEVHLIDAMKSKVIVNSPKVTVTSGLSVFRFMQKMREDDLIVDDTSFDIDDWYYETDDEDSIYKDN